MKRERSEEFNPWKRFKEASVLSKIGYVFLLLIYLVLPIPSSSSLYRLIFHLVLMGKGFWGRAKAFWFVSSCLFGRCPGFLRLIHRLRSGSVAGIRDFRTGESIARRKGSLQDLVSDAEYYSKEPVAHHEDNFGFLALRTYREWTYTDGEPHFRHLCLSLL